MLGTWSEIDGVRISIVSGSHLVLVLCYRLGTSPI